MDKKRERRKEIEQRFNSNFWNAGVLSPKTEENYKRNYDKGIIQIKDLEDGKDKNLTQEERMGNLGVACHQTAFAAAQLGKYRESAIYFTKASEFKYEVANLYRSLNQTADAPNFNREAVQDRKYAQEVRHQAAREKLASKKGLRGLLRKLHPAAAVVALLVSGFFFSPTLTGNAIGTMGVAGSGIIGLLFFLVGILELYVFVNNSRNEYRY
jgi:lipopolysaccharide export LptBFGC system permease protein LptF